MLLCQNVAAAAPNQYFAALQRKFVPVPLTGFFSDCGRNSAQRLHSYSIAIQARLSERLSEA